MTDKLFDQIFPFPTARPHQRNALEAVLNAFDEGKKFVALSAPVGFGKSAVGYAAGTALGGVRALVHQKILQDQYCDSFSTQFHGMETVKGKANYSCRRNAYLKCDFGVCDLGKSKEKCTNCPYRSARDAAFSASHSTLNYDYFLNMSRSEFPGMTASNLLLLDECHTLEEVLVKFASVAFKRDDFNKNDFVMPILPKESMSDEGKLKWMREQALPKIAGDAAYAKEELAAMDEKDPELPKMSRRYRFIDTIVCQCGRLVELMSEDESNIPVAQQIGTSELEIRPLHGGLAGHMHLFKWGEKVLMMSATLLAPEVFRASLRIPKEEFAYVEAPSTFPPERSPKVLMPVGSMARASKADTLPLIVDAVKMILEKHKGERGIIHTVSYDICEKLVGGIATDRFIVPRGKNRDSQIEYFKNSKRNDLVLLSPALSEGISLDGDLARFSILCKVPYPNLGDKWIKLRLDESQGWYVAKTATTILQMTGRAVRSEEDYACTYILDSDFVTFLKRNKSMFPQYWLQGLQVL